MTAPLDFGAVIPDLGFSVVLRQLPPTPRSRVTRATGTVDLHQRAWEDLREAYGHVPGVEFSETEPATTVPGGAVYIRYAVGETPENTVTFRGPHRVTEAQQWLAHHLKEFL